MCDYKDIYKKLYMDDWYGPTFGYGPKPNEVLTNIEEVYISRLKITSRTLNYLINRKLII
jgi:hypothetical protein